MTNGTALLRGLRGIDRIIVGHIMSMRMAVEVVRRMTGGAIARAAACQLGRVVMADITVVMLDVVGRVYKGHVVHCRGMTAAAFGLLRHQGGVVLSVRGPVSGLAAVAGATVIHCNGDGTVGSVTGSTGVMLLVIGWVDEAGTCGQCCSVTAATFAMQVEVTSGCMIDIVIGPDFAGMASGTGVRSVFMGGCRTLEGIRCRVVTGGTAVVDLGVTRIGEGGRRINVTDQTSGFASNEHRGDVINTMIC